MYSMYISETAWGWTECELFERLAEYLTNIGHTTRLQRAECFPVRGRFGQRKSLRIHDSLAYLQDDAIGRFSLLACSDWPNAEAAVLVAAARDPRCTVILKQQYQPAAFHGVLKRKVRPWTYTASYPTRLASVLPALRRVERTRTGLFFRGAVGHESRAEILEGLRRRGAMGTESSPLPFELYCSELSEYRLALSLPGWGNLCHREIEAFGIGTPVLMPRLRTQLHNDLVPDHHYISVDVDPSARPDWTAAAIERRYRDVAGDTALLGYVSRNAMAWYDDNAAFPNSLRLTAGLLGLSA